MQSIDRKLQRLAREIGASKPKVMSYDDFRFLNHDFKGAAQETDRPSGEASSAQARRSPVVAPPNARFKVGDRVRIFCPGHRRTGHLATVVDVPGGLVNVRYDTDGDVRVWANHASLELIPAEPKADGWIEWKGGECPIPEARPGEWMRRNRAGIEYVAHFPAAQSNCWCHKVPSQGDIVAYRLVKP